VCTGQLVNPDLDDWFSQILFVQCRLVFMPDDSIRPVDPEYASAEHIAAFADAYPALIISEASLKDLNSRLDEELPMNRFRPNIVISGTAPYMEDRLEHFTINGINFYGVKLCARCVLTGVNQEDATTGKEPLKTLASYRRKGHKILFGQNLIHNGTGIISVGSELEVIQLGHEPQFDAPLSEIF
jgi:uncharacterized protein YcbX